MKRLLILLLGLAMLGGCAVNTETATSQTATATTEPTTELATESTTEPEPTTIRLASGEKSGIKWNVLDLDDGKNAAVKKLLSKAYDDLQNKWKHPTELSMGGKTVFVQSKTVREWYIYDSYNPYALKLTLP